MSRCRTIPNVKHPMVVLRKLAHERLKMYLALPIGELRAFLLKEGVSGDVTRADMKRIMREALKKDAGRKAAILVKLVEKAGKEVAGTSLPPFLFNVDFDWGGRNEELERLEAEVAFDPDKQKEDYEAWVEAEVAKEQQRVIEVKEE